MPAVVGCLIVVPVVVVIVLVTLAAALPVIAAMADVVLLYGASVLWRARRQSVSPGAVFLVDSMIVRAFFRARR